MHAEFSRPSKPSKLPNSRIAAILRLAMNPRRWICVLLLLIVPLQVSWGAVSGYCKHESGTAAKHFGHHVHQHDASKSPDTATGDSGTANSIDPDCAGCHFNYSLVIPSIVNTAAIAFAGIAPPEHAARATSRADPPPERPQWPLAA